jgi:crotonobetainyl-CoA:carnitine CoA-transferase CaiB-like acyl-CoA transferase
MLDVQVSTLANQAMNFLVSGKVPQRNGNAHPNIQPQDVFSCKDGDVILVVGNDGQFAKLCDVLGMASCATDPRFASNPERIKNLPALMELIRAEFLKWERREIIEALDQAGVPCGPINSVADVFEDPQVKAREMLRHVEHPSGVLVPQVATPMRFSDAQLPECKAPPLLGQHSNAILQELGYDDFKIKELKDKGVI